MKNAVIWDVAPCRSCEMNRRFGGTYRLHLQCRKIRERGTGVSRCRFLGRRYVKLEYCITGIYCQMLVTRRGIRIGD
jgi:hypothetical protein